MSGKNLALIAAKACLDWDLLLSWHLPLQPTLETD